MKLPQRQGPIQDPQPYFPLANPIWSKDLQALFDGVHKVD